jgi:hypothetical protein
MYLYRTRFGPLSCIYDFWHDLQIKTPFERSILISKTLLMYLLLHCCFVCVAHAGDRESP